MPITPKMNALEAEIRRDEGLLANRHLQDGAIVADAGGNSSSSRDPAPDARDQQFFGMRQGKANIAKMG
jgi:hypothetical protein